MSYNATYMKFVTMIMENKLKKAKDFLEENKIDVNVRPTRHDDITVFYGKDSNLKVIKYLLEEKVGNVLAFLETTQLDEYIKGVEGLIKKKINAEILYENSFIHGCAQGTLDIAKYAFSKNQNINVNAHNNMALRLSCLNNQLNSVIYLISKSVEITENELLLSSYKASYHRLLTYPKDEDQYDLLKYFLKNYKFEDIASVSDKIIDNLTYDLIRPYPNRSTYDKVHEVITTLVVEHNIPYTEKIRDLLKDEADLKKIFETRELYEKLHLESEDKIGKSCNKSKI